MNYVKLSQREQKQNETSLWSYSNDKAQAIFPICEVPVHIALHCHER